MCHVPALFARPCYPLCRASAFSDICTLLHAHLLARLCPLLLPCVCAMHLPTAHTRARACAFSSLLPNMGAHTLLCACLLTSALCHCCASACCLTCVHCHDAHSFVLCYGAHFLVLCLALVTCLAIMRLCLLLCKQIKLIGFSHG